MRIYLWFQYLPYRIRSWWDWVDRFYIRREKFAAETAKRFQFMTLPVWPQIDRNITYCKNEGATQLIPFSGKDVKPVDM